MRNILGIQTLLVVLVGLICHSGAVVISDIFTVHNGTDPGNCNGRANVLNDWLKECSTSLYFAQKAMNVSDSDLRVQKSLETFFKIRINNRNAQDTRTIASINKRLKYMVDFIDNKMNLIKSKPIYDKDEYWLHCHSTFLVEEDPADQARDLSGKGIFDKSNNPVPIKDVPRYKTELKTNRAMKPWWPEALTDLNGYFFDDEGGRFCDKLAHMGATARIQRINQLRNGAVALVSNDWRASIIICPQAFDNTDAPDTYLIANQKIKAGTSISLHEVVPKSATLFHESLHALLGTQMLSGDEEQYDLMDSIHLSRADCMRNIENLVFFVVHMMHLMGVDQGPSPESIPDNWDFEIRDQGGNKTFASIAKTP